MGGTEISKGWSLWDGYMDVIAAGKALPVVGRQPSHLEESWCDVRGLVTAFHALSL